MPGLNRVPEKALEAMLQGNNDWLTLLDYVNGDDTSMVPSDGACASLRLFDFGRGTWSTCTHTPCFVIPGPEKLI